MADTTSDVKLRIEALADIASAKEEIAKQFSEVETMLKKIGTSEAKELGKQISAVMEGIKKNAIDAEDIEQIALAFSGISDLSKLTDNNIKNISQSIDNTVGNSRKLSDWMGKVAKSGSESKKFWGNISDSIDDIVPEARSFTDSVSKWAQRIPGVSSLLGKMGAAAGPLALGFKAVAAAAATAIGVLKEWQSTYLTVADRKMRIDGEVASNDRAAQLARLELAERRRREEVEGKRAIEDAQNAINAIDRQRDYYIGLKSSDVMDSEGRQLAQRDYERREEDTTAALSLERMKTQKIDLENEKKELDKRREAEQRFVAKEEERLGKISQLKQKMDVERSAFTKYAEEMYRQQGLDTTQQSVMDKINGFVSGQMKNWMNDKMAGVAASLGINDFDPQKAQQLFENYADQERNLKKSLDDKKREIEGLDLDIEKNKRDMELLAKGIAKNEAETKARKAQREYEDALVTKERDMRITETSVDNMAVKNRLTAMGLGGGNVGGFGGEISKTTKEILAELKEQRREGMRKGLTDSKSMNGPAIAARTRLGDIGWGM